MKNIFFIAVLGFISIASESARMTEGEIECCMVPMDWDPSHSDFAPADCDERDAIDGIDARHTHDAFTLSTLPAELIQLIANSLSLSDIQALAKATFFQFPLIEEIYYQKKFMRDFGVIKNKTMQKTLTTAKKRSVCGTAERKKYLRMKEITLKRNLAHLRAHACVISVHGKNKSRYYFETANFNCMELRFANLDHTNCQRASFIGTNFGYATFFHANVRDACFAFAVMNKALFGYACADNADFRDAELREARFTNACLRGACFDSANLDGAIFHNANIDGADFSHASFEGADFTGAHYTVVHDNLRFRVVLDAWGNVAQKYLIESHEIAP